MRKLVVQATVAALLLAACALRPADEAEQTGELDLGSASGRVTLSGWEASPQKGRALGAALDGCRQEYPDIEALTGPRR